MDAESDSLLNNKNRKPERTSGYERITNGKRSTSIEPFFDSETLRSPNTKYFLLAYTCAVVGIVLITFVLSIVRGIKYGAIYILLGVSVLCIAMIELMLVYLLRKDEIPRDKIWYLFLCGLCLFIEAVLTTVVLYENP